VAIGPPEVIFQVGKPGSLRLAIKNTSPEAVTVADLPPAVTLLPVAGGDKPTVPGRRTTTVPGGGSSAVLAPGESYSYELAWGTPDSVLGSLTLGTYRLALSPLLATCASGPRSSLTLPVPGLLVVQPPGGVRLGLLPIDQQQSDGQVTVGLRDLVATQSRATLHARLLLPPGSSDDAWGRYRFEVSHWFDDGPPTVRPFGPGATTTPPCQDPEIVLDFVPRSARVLHVAVDMSAPGAARWTFDVPLPDDLLPLESELAADHTSNWALGGRLSASDQGVTIGMLRAVVLDPRYLILFLGVIGPRDLIEGRIVPGLQVFDDLGCETHPIYGSHDVSPRVTILHKIVATSGRVGSVDLRAGHVAAHQPPRNAELGVFRGTWDLRLLERLVPVPSYPRRIAVVDGVPCLTADGIAIASYPGAICPGPGSPAVETPSAGPHGDEFIDLATRTVGLSMLVLDPKPQPRRYVVDLRTSGVREVDEVEFGRLRRAANGGAGSP
jgi:hypothetical protein